jgi:GTP:adenosylcobinamide-phosphate guanylyltransferase
MRKVSAIIMAGGKGTRFGGAIPKCLAALADGSTLLGRLIQQLQDAQVEQIIVCTSPENLEAIARHCGIYAMAVACGNCVLGPLPALAEALNHSSGEKNLVCLGDIYFQTSPFGQLEDLCLAVGDNGTNAGSGWVVRDGPVVRGISYLRTANADTRWTGTFLFNQRLAANLVARAHSFSKKPFEAWIGGLIEDDNILRWIDAGGVVNVNSADDYARVLEMTRPIVHEHNRTATARA